MVIKGVIRPPPEIRAVADRTASYVAKNGRAFEAMILKSERGKTPKFAFLQPNSPFHAYYEDRLKFYGEGGEDEKEEKELQKKKETKVDKNKEEQQEQPKKGPPKETVRKKESKQKASAIDPIAKALLTQRSKIKAHISSAEGEENEDTNHNSSHVVPPPPAFELVSIVAPANLSPSQIETIQLVAQFAAMDGKGGPFLHQLTVREWTNPEFAFCQPRHAHFAYFSALVDAYRQIISNWTAAAATSAAAIAGDEKKEETSAVVQVVDVIEVLDEAAYRAEYEREMESKKSQQEEGEIVAIDWHDFVVVETIDFPVDEAVELGMLPPPPPPPPQKTDLPVAAAAKREETNTMDESDDDDDDDEQIRVVPSYTPKVVGTTNVHQARAIDPITGKSVSVADMPEHMRIQLLDPKWAEERKKFQEKQKDSNLVAGDAIVSNISRFAQARGDLFGKSEQELLDKEKDSKRRLEEANRVLREQAYQQPPTVGGPSMHAAHADSSSEPSAKRMRMDTSVSIPPPPPPPPPPPGYGNIPPPPTAAAAPPNTGPPPGEVMQRPSLDPMADAMLPGDASTNNDEKKLLPELEFAASLSKPEVTLQIRIPNDPTQMAWNFYGQILSLTVNVMSKVKEVKSELSRLHLNGMPANKIQFKDPQTGFLKDNSTLAALNIGPTATLEMRSKQRGGRK